MKNRFIIKKNNKLRENFLISLIIQWNHAFIWQKMKFSIISRILYNTILYNMVYEDRLRELGLTDLETRKKRLITNIQNKERIRVGGFGYQRE